MQRSALLSTAAPLAAIGLAAGLIGATVMLLGQKAEMAATGRTASRTPAKAIETLANAGDQSAAVENGLSTAGHFAFGISLGLGLSAMAKLPEPARTGLFFVGAWGTGATLITSLNLSDPPTKWTPAQLATDLGHHLVYAVTAGLAFSGLRHLAKV